MKITTKKVFSFRTLISKITELFTEKTIYGERQIWFYLRGWKYNLKNKVRYKIWLFKESFKWHVKCYLVFWRLPTLLKNTLDGFYASESLSKNQIESMQKRYEDVKFRYDIPDPKEKHWEEDMEDQMMAMPGGPDYEERPSVIEAAKYTLKKYNFKSKYRGDWGIDE
tara:strand:+ start:705 stop:1205 length:501 start_codon:yes stop_codon:yes gene_type:complete